MQHDTVIVVAGGPPPSVGADALPAGAPVVAADGGLDHALALRLHVTVAVGDFDSASEAALVAAGITDTRLEEHPAEKDATDLELALDAAAALGPRRILVVGSDGGRLDHLLATAFLLGAERYAPFVVDAYLGDATVHVVRDERRFAGDPGELVSLLPLGGPAEGVVTEGLVYPLRGETARPRLLPRRLERPRGRPRTGRARRGHAPRGPPGARMSTRRGRGDARRARRRLRRLGREGADRGRARHPRLVRGLEGRPAGVSARVGPEAPDPPDRRRGRRPEPRAADRGQARG